MATHTIGEVGQIEGVSDPQAYNIVRQPNSQWERVGRNEYVKKEGDGNPINFAEWRAYKERETALIRAIERRKLEGEVVPVAMVQKIVAQLVLTTRNRIMSLPKMLAPQLALETESPFCESILDDHLRECLDELANLDTSEFIETDGGTVGVVSPATKANDKRVGRRKPKTASGK